MRIVYVLPSEHFGGAERQAVQQIRALLLAGVDVLPVVGPGRLIADELHRLGVGDMLVSDDLPITAPSGAPAREWLRHAPWFARAFRRTRRQIAAAVRRRNADVVVAARSVGWIFAALSAHDVGVPYVVRAGSRPTRTAERLGIDVLRRTYGPPALVVANCEAVRRDVAPLFRAPSVIVPNIIDAATFDPARARASYREWLRVDAGTPVIGLPARPAPGKGFELFLDVVRRIGAVQPHARFLVAGEFGWRRYYEQLFRRNGFADRVTFLGHVHDMENFYASCDVIVLTSRAHSIEGSPNALLEALCMGRPVVSTRVGGVEELIDDGIEGLLVEDGDADTFAGRVLEVLGSSTLGERLGAAGQRRVNGQHGAEPAICTLLRAIASHLPPTPPPLNALRTRRSAGL